MKGNELEWLDRHHEAVTIHIADESGALHGGSEGAHLEQRLHASEISENLTSDKRPVAGSGNLGVGGRYARPVLLGGGRHSGAPHQMNSAHHREGGHAAAFEERAETRRTFAGSMSATVI